MIDLLLEPQHVVAALVFVIGAVLKRRSVLAVGFGILFLSTWVYAAGWQTWSLVPVLTIVATAHWLDKREQERELLTQATRDLSAPEREALFDDGRPQTMYGMVLIQIHETLDRISALRKRPESVEFSEEAPKDSSRRG